MSWIVDIPTEKLHSFSESFFLFSSQDLLSRVAKLCSVLPVGHIFFPIKANPTFLPLKLMAEQGLGADCTDTGEVELALAAGFIPKNIIYNSVQLDGRCAKYILQKGGIVVLDSIQQLQQLYSEMPTTLTEGRFLLRINVSKEKMTSFGEELLSWVECDLISKISLVGIHISSGTADMNIQTFVDRISLMDTSAEAIEKKLGIQLRVFDIGGGLGLDYTQLTDSLMDQFLDILRQTLSTNPSRIIWIELGRALLGPSIALFTKIKEIDSQITLTANGNIHLNKDQVPFLWETKEKVVEGDSLLVFSPPILKFTKNFRICSNKLQKNDVLFFPHCGAYVQALTVEVAGYSNPTMVHFETWENVDLPYHFVHPVWSNSSLLSFLRYTKPSFSNYDVEELKSGAEFLQQSKMMMKSAEWEEMGISFKRIQKSESGESSKPTMLAYIYRASAVILYFGNNYKGVCQLLRL